LRKLLISIPSFYHTSLLHYLEIRESLEEQHVKKPHAGPKKILVKPVQKKVVARL